jgi:hypothetical protein
VIEHSLCGCLSHQQPDSALWMGSAETFRLYCREDLAEWERCCAIHHVYCCQESQRNPISDCTEGRPATCPHTVRPRR